MVLTRVSGAPEKLELGKEETIALVQLRDSLRDEIVEAYEDYVIRNNNGVNNRWKLAKTDREMRAYRESKRGVEARKTSVSDRHPQARLASECDVRRVMIIARMPGSLDDAMYAHTVYDTPSLRTRGAYLQGELLDCAMLATIAQPTEVEPYRFCGVAWYLKTIPSNFVRDRDTLVLSCTGTGVLSNGERYGYSIIHSITLDGLPVLPEHNFVRADVSFLTVFREVAENEVEAFAVSFIDVKGSVPKTFQVQELSRILWDMRGSGEIALNLKLFERFVIQSRNRSNTCKSETMISIESSGETPDACECCSRKFGHIFCSSQKCQLCEKHICRKCASRRDLVVHATDEVAIVKPVNVCVSCILETRSSSSLDAARRAVRASKRIASFTKLSPQHG